MLEFVNKYGYNITSQNGENGIINECLFRIKPDNKIACEFGAPDTSYCSNIKPLKGFELVYFDIDPKDADVMKAFITEDNVNELIPDCSVLSIDIDGNDFNIWKAYKGLPDIVVIEINSSLNTDVEFFHPEKGASFCTMLRLGVEKGYFLLCHTGNMIFILNEHRKLFPEVEEVTTEKFFNKSWL